MHEFSAQRTQLKEQLELWEKGLPSWLRRDADLPNFAQADVSTSLPFSTGTFDFVYARFVLNFLDRDDHVRSAGRHVARILRQAGRFALVEPADKDGVRRDYARILTSDIGLVLLDKIEGDVERLGGLDTRSGEPQADYLKQPVGYLFGVA